MGVYVVPRQLILLAVPLPPCAWHHLCIPEVTLPEAVPFALARHVHHCELCAVVSEAVDCEANRRNDLPIPILCVDTQGQSRPSCAR